MTPPYPSGAIERPFVQQGQVVCGVDEVGRGCLAGPVFAGAAILDLAALLEAPFDIRILIRDSKTLRPTQRAEAREKMAPYVIDATWAWASVEEVDALGIVPACFLAMKRSIALLHHPFDHLLVDGSQPISRLPLAQTPVVKGDQHCFSIAAASIVAKLERDHYMTRKAQVYPAYGFESHVGYGTQKHLAALGSHGVTPLHRKSFAPIRGGSFPLAPAP